MVGGRRLSNAGLYSDPLSNLVHLRRSSCMPRIRKDSALSSEVRSRTASGGSEKENSDPGKLTLFVPTLKITQEESPPVLLANPTFRQEEDEQIKKEH